MELHNYNHSRKNRKHPYRFIYITIKYIRLKTVKTADALLGQYDIIILCIPRRCGGEVQPRHNMVLIAYYNNIMINYIL